MKSGLWSHHLNGDRYCVTTGRLAAKLELNSVSERLLRCHEDPSEIMYDQCEVDFS